MTLDGAPAVHQSIQLGQGDLLVLSSLRHLLSILAEVLPLESTCDLVVEPFARACDTAELGNQLRLAHLVQANHRGTKPTGTAGPVNICKDADQVSPEDQ